jgi:hypothetical protein
MLQPERPKELQVGLMQMNLPSLKQKLGLMQAPVQ